MRLLDLFCGAGGAAMGYSRAGFDDIVGVDINPQPNYPFEFYRADVTRFTPNMLHGFDLIHASPPCQAYSTLRHSPGNVDYPDLIDSTRRLLQSSGLPYVIENVAGAPLGNPVQLCGSSFDLRHDGFELRRHRLFESSFPVLVPPCDHQDPVLGVYGDLSKTRRKSTRGVKAGIVDAQELMGIDWMTPAELTEAIPPAYTEYLGRQFLDQLARL
jgi:DNA (cytosine-5)-methyltransferase 1